MTEEKNNNKQENPEAWLNEDTSPEQDQNQEQPAGGWFAENKTFVIISAVIAACFLGIFLLAKYSGNKDDKQNGSNQEQIENNNQNKKKLQDQKSYFSAFSKEAYDYCTSDIGIGAGIGIAATLSGLAGIKLYRGGSLKPKTLIEFIKTKANSLKEAFTKSLSSGK